MPSRINPTAIPPLPFYTASEILSFGHSIASHYGATTPELGWGQRLSKAVDADLDLKAVDGAVALYDDTTSTGDGGWNWVFSQLTPTRNAGPYIAAWPMVSLYFGHNDVALYDDSAGTLAQVKSVIRAMILRARCALVRENNHASVAYSGFVNTNFTVTAGSSGDTVAYTQTGSTPTVTITTPTDFQGGTVILGLLTGGKGEGATFSVTVGGQAWNIKGATTATAQDTRNLAPSFNEITRLDISGGATGTYTVTFSGQTTGTISASASAATVQTALENLSNVAPGDVIATGGPGNTAPIDLEWTGAQKGVNVTDPTWDTTLLIGGTKTLSTLRQGGSVRTVASAWRLENVPAGAQTIVLTVGTLQTTFFFDWWGIEAETPPVVLLPLPVRANSYQIYNSYLYPLDDAALIALRGAIVELAAEFTDGYVITADADADINKASRYFFDPATDGVHLNDAGHEVFAAALLKALATKLPASARAAVSSAKKSSVPHAALPIKRAVRAASVANVVVSNPATAVFDTVTLTPGQRLLLKNQTAPAENGIYIFSRSNIPLLRASDFDSPEEIIAGTEVAVEAGSQRTFKYMCVPASTPVVVGTTALRWTRTAPDIMVSPQRSYWTPANNTLENFPRFHAESTVAAGTSGTLYLIGGIVIPAGHTVTNVNMVPQANSSGTVTGVWFVIARADTRAVVANTANSTAQWTANTVRTAALQATYTPDEDMPVYVGVMSAIATTRPTFYGMNPPTGVQAAPIMYGASNTGQGATPITVTTVLTAVTATLGCPYVYLT